MSKSINASRSDTQSNLEQALIYAEWGWHVLPMHSIDPSDGRCTCGNPDCGDAGKHPLTEHGCKDATQNEEQIRRWYEETSGCCNWGIATGERSDLLVIDADDMEGFQALEKEHGPMPLTPTVQTGREPLGKHYYFRYPQGSGITVGTGKAYGLPFDWRGEGGLVVAPAQLAPLRSALLLAGADAQDRRRCTRLVDGIDPEEADAETEAGALAAVPTRGNRTSVSVGTRMSNGIS